MTGGAGASVSWQRVLALRLERQHVLERTTPDCLVDVVRDLVGVHAQVMLPGFDPFTNELPRKVGSVLDEARHELVHRTAGWVTPIVIVDGRLDGTWEIGGNARHGVLEVRRSSRWRGGVARELAVEVDRIAAFLDRPMTLEVSGG